MNIIDAHAHLDHIKNLDRALDNAKGAKVEAIVAVSTEYQSCLKNIEIKRRIRCPKICLALGMHPSDADENQVDLCVELIKAHREDLVAVGEIGLDFWYKDTRKDKIKKDIQRQVFQRQLIVAYELGLPVIVHTRGTWREAFETVKGLGIKMAEFHWYSGPLDVLSDILNQGYFVSTSPSVAYSLQTREAMAYAPVEQTLIETDCPVFYKNRESDDPGFEAEPKDVWRTLKAYAQLKNMDEDEALEIVNKNARAFFNIS